MTSANVRKLRKKLGLSQVAFAEECNVVRRTAQGWESDDCRHEPSRMAKRELARLWKKAKL